MIATKTGHKCKVFHIYIDTVREAEHESEIDQVVKRPTLRLKLGCIIYIYIYACLFYALSTTFNVLGMESR